MDIQENYWATEGENIDNKELDNVIYRNADITEFLYTETKNFIIAPKGVGKTIILKAKRYLFEKTAKEKRNQEIAENEGEKNSILFYPSSNPYLDFASSFGYLDKKMIGFLSKWENCKKLWQIALQLSIISYFSAHSRVPIDPDFIKSLPETLSDVYRKNENVDPTQMLRSILMLSVSEFQSLYNVKNVEIDKLYSGKIQSGICIFIDRIDQALEEYPLAVWIGLQVGLIEAAWDLTRANHHVKIYSSIRLEAYANYVSKNKQAMRGNITLLKYTASDLKQILNKLSKYYTDGSFEDFIGIREVTHPETGHSESIFDCALRHTLSRPRDLVCIGASFRKLSDDPTYNFRYAVNETSHHEIGTTIFVEKNKFIPNLGQDVARNRFFGLIHKNVLTYDEMVEICRVYNNKSTCGLTCEQCAQVHPFCELYNIGLLGVIERNDHSSTVENVQRFLQPWEIMPEHEVNLPRSSNCYLIHPCLNHTIRMRRRNVFESIVFITVGNGLEWKNGYDQCVELNTIIRLVKDITLRKELVSELGKLINNANRPEGDFSKQAERVRKIAIGIAEVADKASRIVDFGLIIAKCFND